MIKLSEFVPNEKEKQFVRFGNEERAITTIPSLMPDDVEAMQSEDVWGQPSDDHESMMAKGELRDMISNASKIYNMIEPGTELPGWVSAYITLASDYMHSVAEYATENAPKTN
jgi:hypothetical protein